MKPNRSARLRELIGSVTVIPVLVIDDVADAVPLARALAEGGLARLEITLRTPLALPAIAAIARALPEVVVGAGTLRNADDAKQVSDAGAAFAVSPGYTVALGEACASLGLPLLPGVATASEVMLARDQGHDLMKFFPAEAAGGIALLNALAGPFPDVAFCPTGGIDSDNAARYLARPNVKCVGGSWVAPREAIAAGDWPRIRELALAASRLARNA